MTLYKELFKIMTASIAQQKIRIRLKAFDRRMLDLSCDKIIQTNKPIMIKNIPMYEFKDRSKILYLIL